MSFTASGSNCKPRANFVNGCVDDCKPVARAYNGGGLGTLGQTAIYVHLYTSLFAINGSKMQKRLTLVRGTSPLRRVVLLSEQSVTPTSGRLVSAVVDSAAARMPSDSAISTRFLSSVSDSRGLVAAAAVALGAQPIAVSDHRRHSARRVPPLVLSHTH